MRPSGEASYLTCMRIQMLLLLLFPVGMAAQSGPLKLSGTLPVSSPVDWVFLQYYEGDKNMLDSLPVQSGRFEFNGQLAEPVLASIRFRSPRRITTGDDGTSFRFALFLVPGAIKLKVGDSIQAISVSGASAAHEEYLQLQRRINDFSSASAATYSQARAANDSSVAAALSQQAASIWKSRQSFLASYIEHNPASPLALWALRTFAGPTAVLDPQKVRPLFELLTKESREGPEGKRIAQILEGKEATALGRPAPDFVQTDTAGTLVSLSSFCGRWVLIDFWASWCVPCREENPNLVNAFNAHKEKNFTILSVSLDKPDGRAAWLAAIRKDGLGWNHVSDLKYWENAAAKQYGVRSVPANFLISPQGIIVAKNLSGAALEQKLSELLLQ
jgi:peroxiredoxin